MVTFNQTTDPRKTGGRFVTIDGHRVFIPRGAKIRPARVVYPQGAGVRLTYSRVKYLRNDPNLVRIKLNQQRAEIKAGIRVKNGLFENIFVNNPKVIGVVKIERKRQQHPHSGKNVLHPRRGGRIGKGTKTKPVRQKRRGGMSLRQKRMAKIHEAERNR